MGMTYLDCFMCNGTGIDNSDWSGKCFSCRGSGVVADEDDDPIDDDPFEPLDDDENDLTEQS